MLTWYFALAGFILGVVALVITLNNQAENEDLLFKQVSEGTIPVRGGSGYVEGSGTVKGDLIVTGDFRADNSTVIGWADLHFGPNVITAPFNTLVNMYDGSVPLFNLPDACGLCFSIEDGQINVLRGGIYKFDSVVNFGSLANITNFEFYLGINGTPDLVDPNVKLGTASCFSNVLPNNAPSNHIYEFQSGDVLTIWTRKTTNNADTLSLINGSITITRLGLRLEDPVSKLGLDFESISVKK